ncbi:MAG: hypothetical protein KME40_14370 [Komarekiella atlantica HA4396-MV6]|nr:hypothetical protein [Komarekiella atlantica HA4396-MV6]
MPRSKPLDAYNDPYGEASYKANVPQARPADATFALPQLFSEATSANCWLPRSGSSCEVAGI